MSNRSKVKREKLLYFLSRIRDEHNDDSSLIAINEIISELMEKKYGLVWEEHTERVDQEIIDKIPVFTEDKAKMISEAEDKDFNFLLEGDNLHSLYLMEKTHKGKVDGTRQRDRNTVLLKKNNQTFARSLPIKTM